MSNMAPVDVIKVPAEALFLSNKFSLDENDPLLVLGTPFVNKPKTTKKPKAKMATSSSNSKGSDRKVATNTTLGSGCETVADLISREIHEKKLATAATPSRTVENATVARTLATTGTTAEKWSQIWELLGSSPDMAKDKRNCEPFKAMLDDAMGKTGPPQVRPVCRNPTCGKPGHTLAVCPVPTRMCLGDMVGCFFCNIVDHEVDDCPMMAWVSPAQLVTYLIHNRAGLPPWSTRIDWVALANDNWDLVDYTMLPLTRAFVTKKYIPNKLWRDITTSSPHTDPLFRKADRKLLRTLSKKPTTGPRPRLPTLMEADKELCYCRSAQCSASAQPEHHVFKNERVQRYIPDMQADAETIRELERQQERAIAETQLRLTKQMPKKVTKERKGRRAMKREALAAAAAAEKEKEKEKEEQAKAGASNEDKGKKDESKDQASEEEGDFSDDDRCLSDRMLNCLDAAESVRVEFQRLGEFVQP